MKKSITRRQLLQGTAGVVASCAFPPREIKFKKHVLDKRLVAEGVAVGDVNRDGRLDVIAGNIWYEAPHWTPHEIAPYKQVDPANGYSNCFNSWAEDLNHDDWIDQIVIGMPGERAFWRENPGKKSNLTLSDRAGFPSPAVRKLTDPSRGGEGFGPETLLATQPRPILRSLIDLPNSNEAEPWKEHPIWRSACNESPLYVDLLGNGKRVLVMGYDDKYMAWFEPSEDPYAEWQCHNVSEENGAGAPRYSHGLGVGDINKDGRNEIIVREGYYVMPNDPRGGPWKFIKADLGDECAQMRVFDVNGDGLPDVISSSAHKRGVWWYEQLAGGTGFRTHVIDQTISETHSLELAKIGGRMNAITGKRFYAHPPGVDVGSNEPALLVRYELTNGDWVRHLIDDDSGVGTQFVVHDMTGKGLLDIVISNKKGVFLFEQLR